MVAGALDRWLQVERHVGIPMRALYALLALWLWHEGALSAFRAEGFPGWWAFVLFAVVSALVVFVWPRLTRLWPLALFQLVDAIFLAYVIAQSRSVAGPAPWLFVLWVGKQAILAASTPTWYLVAFLSGPLYLAAAYSITHTWGFVLDRVFQQTYALLFVATVAGWGIARHLWNLQVELAQEREDLARKTEVLQRTATDLGARVLELRALQEVAHQLSTSLHLEQALDVIAQRARELFNVSHVAILLAGEGERRWRLHHLSDTGARTTLEIPPNAAVYTHLTRASAFLVHPTHPDGVGQTLLGIVSPLWSTLPLIAIPLITRGRLVAVLLLGTTAEEVAFGERQEQLAESFAFLAATAIENARLYENVLEQRQELEAVLQGIGDAVIVTDAEMKVLMANPVAVRTLHMPPSPVGHPLGDVIANDELLGLIHNVFHGEEPVQMQDVTFEFPGEKPRTFQAVASAIRGHGRAARGVVTVLRDITAQKELERMKSNFLSVVSHELKTPLHSIKGFVEIIRMGKAGPITELQADFLTTVKEQTQVLQRMIDDLLVFSRLEAGQLRLHIEEVALATIATGVVQKLSPLARENNLLLESRLPDDFPDVEGDYMRLEQVLTNLVENAIKFTPPGGVVTIDGEDLGDRVRIWVQDTGIGIPESEQERIFDRFYQVDASERRAYRGAGLGLTICKHIVLRHHGRIWVRSKPGEGSTFFVELPKRLPPVSEPLDFYTDPSTVQEE